MMLIHGRLNIVTIVSYVCAHFVRIFIESSLTTPNYWFPRIIVISEHMKPFLLSRLLFIVTWLWQGSTLEVFLLCVSNPWNRCEIPKSKHLSFFDAEQYNSLYICSLLSHKLNRWMLNKKERFVLTGCKWIIGIQLCWINFLINSSCNQRCNKANAIRHAKYY